MKGFQLNIDGIVPDISPEGYAVLLENIAEKIRTEGTHPPGVTVHDGPAKLYQHTEWKFTE